MRQLVLADPARRARLCGIPALTNLLHLDVPKDAISLGSLTAAYDAFSPSKSKNRTLDIFKQMARHTHAKTLADLTIEKLGSIPKSRRSNQQQWEGPRPGNMARSKQ